MLMNTPVSPLPDMQTILSVVKCAVRRHSRRCHCSPEERDDLFQDGCLAALRASSSYRQDGGASYRTWISRRVQGELVDSLKRQRSHGFTHLPPSVRVSQIVHPMHGTGEDSILDDHTECSSPEAVTEQAQALARLNAELPERHLQLLADHFGFNGPPMSTREIAIPLGISHVAVVGRIDRAIRHAQSLLTQV
jgi:RNA polymerase sigma factor (sigma-70 family)